MKGEFVIRTDKQLYTYTDTKDIPETFDNLIKFAPEYPKAPHTEIEHEDISKFMDVLKELMSREKK